jgi:hypothetical protein
VYRKAADLGDVVIQKRHFAIADTRGRVSAMPVQALVYVFPESSFAELHEDKNRILGVGHHQGARELISLGLHRIKLVSSRCNMLPKDVRWLVNSSPVQTDALFFVVSDPSERGPVRIDDLGRVGIDGGRRVYGDLMTGTLSSWNIYCVSYLTNAEGDFSLTYG